MFGYFIRFVIYILTIIVMSSGDLDQTESSLAKYFRGGKKYAGAKLQAVNILAAYSHQVSIGSDSTVSILVQSYNISCVLMYSDVVCHFLHTATRVTFAIKTYLLSKFFTTMAINMC
jgi:hypothetical protein